MVVAHGTTITVIPPPVWHARRHVMMVIPSLGLAVPRRTSNVPHAAAANGITMGHTARRVKVGHKPVVLQVIRTLQVPLCPIAVVPLVVRVTISLIMATPEDLVPRGLPRVPMGTDTSTADQCQQNL